jgi:addiction module HigA family antidote
MPILMEDLVAGWVDLSDVVDPDAPGVGPIHPGEQLRATLEARGVSAYRLAQVMGVPIQRVTTILQGHRAITPDTAYRLGRVLDTSGEFWLGLQASHDLEIARRKAAADEARLVAQGSLLASSVKRGRERRG